jgi:PAS domain S-box-containing protein
MGDRDEGRRARDLRRYETILESLDDAVYAIRPDGTIVYVNERYAEMKGVDREELLGTDIYDWVSEETAERALGERAAMREEGRETGAIEYEFEPVDGDPFPAEMRFGRTDPEDGADLGRVGVIRDISERKERERELERQNERLDEFASLVSHDLRNPLSVADGHLSLAIEEYDDERLERVADAHDRMASIVDDALTWAREGKAVEETEPVDIGELTERSWVAVATESATLSVQSAPTVSADRTRLQRLLENLLQNAVEHGDDEPTVVVGELDERDGFYVADDGPGIDQSEREPVFESGYSGKDDGTGFGLAIVDQIVDAHGWEITVTDSEQGGARFEIVCTDATE